MLFDNSQYRVASYGCLILNLNCKASVLSQIMYVLTGIHILCTRNWNIIGLMGHSWWNSYSSRTRSLWTIVMKKKSSDKIKFKIMMTLWDTQMNWGVNLRTSAQIEALISCIHKMSVRWQLYWIIYSDHYCSNLCLWLWYNHNIDTCRIVCCAFPSSFRFIFGIYFTIEFFVMVY